MIDLIKKDWRAKVALSLFFLLTVWWVISPSFQGSEEKRFFGDFPSTYVVMALLGALYGLVISQKWGGFKSVIGRSIMMFSLGLFAQVFGQIVYAYYSFYQNIAIPYPSLGDLGYFGSIPFYIYGVWLMAQASGVKFSLKSIQHKIQGVIIPIFMLIFSYLFFLQGYEFDWSQPLTIFLDFGYPLGQAIYVSIALLTYLLSRNLLGGIMKSRILIILVALFIQYLSDFTFLYQAYNEIWYAGGINDYMYLVAYLFMALALLNFNTQVIKQKLDQ